MVWLLHNLPSVSFSLACPLPPLCSLYVVSNPHLFYLTRWLLRSCGASSCQSCSQTSSATRCNSWERFVNNTALSQLWLNWLSGQKKLMRLKNFRHWQLTCMRPYFYWCFSSPSCSHFCLAPAQGCQIRHYEITIVFYFKPVSNTTPTHDSLQYRLATDHARPQTELRARQEDPTTIMARWKINGIITSIRYIILKIPQKYQIVVWG